MRGHRVRAVLSAAARRVAVHLDEFILAFLLVALGAFLYRLGSPVEWFEDQVHAAIVRRLSVLADPRLDNVYFTPGIVYTYPFPGIHYFMALVAQAERSRSAVRLPQAALLLGPGRGRHAVPRWRVRVRLGGVASAERDHGCRAACSAVRSRMVPGFPSGWGQLIPFSHASDVAMTVLLPALLVHVLRVRAARRRVGSRRFFLVGHGDAGADADHRAYPRSGPAGRVSWMLSGGDASRCGSFRPYARADGDDAGAGRGDRRRLHDVAGARSSTGPPTSWRTSAPASVAIAVDQQRARIVFTPAQDAAWIEFVLEQRPAVRRIDAALSLRRPERCCCCFATSRLSGSPPCRRSSTCSS